MSNDNNKSISNTDVIISSAVIAVAVPLFVIPFMLNPLSPLMLASIPLLMGGRK